MEPIKSHPNRVQGAVFALLIITAGVLLLLFNTGYLPDVHKTVIFSWPMLLVVIGILFIFSPHKRVPGFFLSLLGLLLLLPKLNAGGFTCLKGNGWAIGLIIGGCLLLFRVLRSRSHFCRMEHRRGYYHRRFSSFHSRRMPDEEPGRIATSYVFSGGKEKVTTQNFKGGDIDCIFGAAEIDFMDAQLAEGDSTLNVSAVFGGLTLYIPAHWKVELRQDAVLGRMEDKRARPTFDVHENRTLIIKASMIFGGGEIKTR
ncbi:MAG: cell wall-active antibiotics response protein [Prevotellaceae bacterium]|jgi:predicted membrane protein|nr:cell wall-active antibiotics response protein [Prevotellaceae bacterium]